MRPLGALLVFAGCQSVGTVPLDAPADTRAPDPDGPLPQSQGVFVSWKAQPTLPGLVTDRIAVTAATFQVSHLQVIGDAGPGDERTTHSRYVVSWSAQGTPAIETFPDAPVGVYSKMIVDLAGSSFPLSAYEIDGTWRERAEDSPTPFRIIDRTGLSAAIDCDAALPAGGSAQFTIKLELQDALSGLNFDDIDEDGGVRVLDTFDRQMPAFRDRLRRGFTSD